MLANLRGLWHQAKELFKFYFRGLTLIITHRMQAKEIQNDLARLVPFIAILLVLEEVISLIVLYRREKQRAFAEVTRVALLDLYKAGPAALVYQIVAGRTGMVAHDSDASALHLFALARLRDCLRIGRVELAIDRTEHAINVLEATYEETEDPLIVVESLSAFHNRKYNRRAHVIFCDVDEVSECYRGDALGSMIMRP
ncbi:hypothetical protein BGW80DRAFT_1560437 [Lactifluus volemus]|nr:hypothetical protein BGW80DRAFT_1560437 [Lactifluus volemus]